MCLSGLQLLRSTDFLNYQTCPGHQFRSYYSPPSSSDPAPPFPVPLLHSRPQTLQEPRPLASFRHRLLLDDVGWVPVVPVDQSPDPGGLGRCGEGGSRRPTAAASAEQGPPHLGPASRPGQRAADPHVGSSQLSARRPGTSSSRDSALVPRLHPRRVTTPLAPFKGLPLPLLPARWRLVKPCGAQGAGGGETCGSRRDLELAKVNLLIRRG